MSGLIVLNPVEVTPAMLTSSARTTHTDISRRRYGETAPGDVEPISRFHYLLTQYSGNAVYAMTFKSFEGTIMRLVRQHLTLAPDIPKSAKLHESLVRSLEAHDAEASAQNVRLCILHGMSALKKLYHT